MHQVRRKLPWDERSSNKSRTRSKPVAASTYAERCQLTVMFCDLVGSTALSVHLDVEDFHEVIAAYQKRVAEIVTRFGGFVARRVGDGVLVYFGFPTQERTTRSRPCELAWLWSTE